MTEQEQLFRSWELKEKILIERIRALCQFGRGLIQNPLTEKISAEDLNHYVNQLTYATSDVIQELDTSKLVNQTCTLVRTANGDLPNPATDDPMDLLCLALPYVEEAQNDPVNKRESVAKLCCRIRKLIEEGKQ